MKANQAFRNADEAVSPVIGVILMVAITVVLAAVVFVLVSNLSKGGQQSAPNLAINVDDTQDRLTVISAGAGADWSRISVQASSCTQTTTTSIINMGTAAPYQNTAAVSGGGDLTAAGTATACGAPARVNVATSTAVIAAGNYLAFCVDQAVHSGAQTSATNVVILLTDTVANSAIGTYTFTSIAPCAS